MQRVGASHHVPITSTRPEHRGMPCATTTYHEMQERGLPASQEPMLISNLTGSRATSYSACERSMLTTVPRTQPIVPSGWHSTMSPTCAGFPRESSHRNKKSDGDAVDVPSSRKKKSLACLGSPRPGSQFRFPHFHCTDRARQLQVGRV